MGRTIDYFVRGYTGLGEVNYIQSNVEDIKNVYILKAANEKTATLFLKEFITLIDDEISIEVIRNPDYAQALDGVIVRGISVAILTTPFIKYVSSHSHLIDLTKYTKLPVTFTAKKRKEIVNKSVAQFTQAFEKFKEIERIYKKDIDYEIVNQIINEFINNNIHNYPNENKKAQVYKRLLGSSTSEGIITCVDNLISPIENQFILKENSNALNSYFMNKIKSKVIQKGYDAEVYKCSFVSNSISMIIIRSMDTCLLDKSSFLDNQSTIKDDQVLDLFNSLSNRINIKKNQFTLMDLKKSYQSKINAGISELTKFEELAGSIEDSAVKLENQEVKTILTDYKINI